MTPGPIDCPACDVPPPRAVIGTPNQRKLSTFRPRRRAISNDDAERHDLVDARIGRIDGAIEAFETDFTCKFSASSSACRDINGRFFNLRQGVRLTTILFQSFDQAIQSVAQTM